jgi:hypothetical protein
LFDATKEALDQVAALVEMAIIEALDGAVLAGRGSLARNGLPAGEFNPGRAEK